MKVCVLNFSGNVGKSTIAASLGLLAAYVGGRTDTVIMRLVDLQLSFPSILVALMILAFLGKGVMNVVIALVIVEWAYYARTVRGTALVERRREYIEAAGAQGGAFFAGNRLWRYGVDRPLTTGGQP